jgi:hypothetical protein
MANPNIVNITTVNGVTTYLTPANNTTNVLLSNAAASGRVYKVNSLIVSNVDTANAIPVTVTVNSAAAGGGTAYPIASTISVPANASLIVIDKTTMFYLTENQSIVVTSGTASKLTYVISYEDMS